MACNKEELSTKDKKQIDMIYNTIKRYIIYSGKEIDNPESKGKGALVNWISNAYCSKNLLTEIISDLTINEYCSIEREEIEDWGGLYEYGRYWFKLGLINTVYDDDSGEFFAYFIKPMAELLNIMPPNDYKTLGYRAAVNSTVSAMVNLYGMVYNEKAYEIFCKVTSLGSKISYEKFLSIALRFCDFRPDYNICNYMNAFVSTDYLNIQNARGVQKITPKPEFYELICRQGDKPFYSDFTIDKLLNYEKPGSFEIDSNIDSFALFLNENFEKSDKEVLNVVDIVSKACIEELGINHIFEILKKYGFDTKSQKIQKLMVKHIMQIKNNVRLRVNRGFTINELRSISYENAGNCINL